MANSRNLKPWPKGVSGNPGGRPKMKPVTEELERLLQQEAPEKNGQTWAALIAERLCDGQPTETCRLLQKWQTGLRAGPPKQCRWT